MSELTKEQCEEIGGRVEPIATCKSWESPIMEEFCLHAVMDVPNLLDTVASLRAKIEDAKGALSKADEYFMCGELWHTDAAKTVSAALAKLEAKQ